jgi:hypothetical protein
LAKARVYCIWYQDGGGKWIDSNVKEAFIFEAYKWENVWDYQSCDGCFKGRDSANPEDVQVYMRPEWLEKNVRTNHGILCEMTPQHWTSEGDTPSWLHLVDNGLESHVDYTIGGWGGRGEYDNSSKPNHITDRGINEDGDGNKHYWRWVIDAQNDYAARADWCVREYEQANHAPVAMFNGSTNAIGPPILNIEANPGQTISLDATGSTDPDGHNLSYKWWTYEYGGSYGEVVSVNNPNSHLASITIPSDAGGKTIQIIIEVTDDGDPPLKGYRRAMINVN